MACFNVSYKTIASNSVSVINDNLMSVWKDSAHDVSRFLGAYWEVIYTLSIFTNLVETSNIMRSEFLSCSTRDSKDFKNSLKIQEISSPRFIISYVD